MTFQPRGPLMIGPPDAAPCVFTPRFGGRRIGPTVGNPAYELAVNGGEHLIRAHLAVLTWAETVHRISLATAATRAAS